jgi:membrane dipeptidase
VGTDFTQDQDPAFFDWLSHDKGYSRNLVTFEPVVNPDGIRKIGDFGNLPVAMEKAGWSERKIRRVMGENWLRVLKEVWGA